jgi:hypothetical protein
MSEAYKLEDLDLDYDYEEEPFVDSLERAEAHLRFLAYWRWYRQDREEHARKEIDKIKLWLEREQERVNKKISWHERGLQGFLWKTGKKSVSLVHGSIRKIKGRERIEITDEEAFLTTAPLHLVNEQLLRRPDKKAILAHIKETGEIPEGTDLIRGEDTIQIKTEDA